MIALADANNFYCSAERVFNPSLLNKPVIVLSNNDGCVISRSNEAKQLGIKMAVPLYQITPLCHKYDVKIFSSNYSLYGDMSQRIMKCLSYFSPEVDIYSIDEAFLNLEGFEYKNLPLYAREIKETVEKWTGIPIALGIASNKTLAKLANHIAKRIKGNGVFQLNSIVQEKRLMQQLEVNEIWGIGKQSQAKLQRSNIDTIWDMYQANPLKIRQILGITGLKTLYDLQGKTVERLDLEIKDKQNVGSSRSFYQPVMSLQILNSALANYVMLAAQKLRTQQLYAQAIQVHLSTNHYRKNTPQYQNSLTLPLCSPSNHTGELISLAKTILKLIYRSGYQYQKVGVLLLDLTKILQTDLFTPIKNDKKNSDNLMLTVDNINKKMGKNNLFFAAQGIKQHWKEKRNFQSPHYTTQWNDLPCVR